MDDEKITKYIDLLTKLTIGLDRELASLKASVVVLKAAVASQLNPGDPLEGAKMLRKSEELILSRDPHVQELEEAHQAIEAMKLWKKHGSHES
jgi:hypothetical protein